MPSQDVVHTVWHRCPAISQEKASNRYGKPLDGCGLHLGLVGVRIRRVGMVYCPHCGADTTTLPSNNNNEALSDSLRDFQSSPLFVKSVEFSSLAPLKRQGKLTFACCYNADCSKRYLPDDARGSLALRKGAVSHSGTGFVWLQPNEPPSDLWRFGSDCPDSFKDDPEEDVFATTPSEESRKTWRRCLFCNNLMRMESTLSRPRPISNSDAEMDQHWDWLGPAMLFRIFRLKEYEKNAGVLVASAIASPGEPLKV